MAADIRQSLIDLLACESHSLKGPVPMHMFFLCPRVDGWVGRREPYRRSSSLDLEGQMGRKLE